MILSPDAEIVALGALRAAMPGVAAGTVAPSSRAAPFMQVRRVGGSMQGRVIDVAAIDVLTHGPDDFSTMQTAQHARAVLLSLRAVRVAGASVLTVSESTGPQRLPDPGDPEKSLVLFTVNMSIRSTES